MQSLTRSRILSGDIINAVFQPRTTHDLKESAIPMIGMQGDFEALWLIEEGEYIGEWAMKIPREWPVRDACWVPDGDLRHAGEGSVGLARRS